MTTTTTPTAKCRKVSLGGAATGGSVAFTATRASKAGKTAVGGAVTLAIPAGARVRATACVDANGALTLRNLDSFVESGTLVTPVPMSLRVGAVRR